MIGDLNPYPEYKDTELHWLGEVPAHWEVRQLGRMGQFSKGNGGTKADEVADGVSCVRYGDLYMQHKFFIRASRSYVTQERAADYTPIRYGDVLFAGSGETVEEIGKSAVNLIESDVCCGGDVILFRPCIDVDPQFMGYATDCAQAVYQKACMGRGVTVMHIYGDQLKYMWMGLPPLGEQTAIVRFLDHVDRRIRRYLRAKRRLIALLEEQKQAIIHRAVTRGLDPNVPLKPSGVEWLGNVPEHWEVRRIASFSPKITNGWVGPTRDILRDSGVPYIQSLHIKRGAIRFAKQYYVSDDWLNACPKIRLRQGDVVVVQTGDIGQVACVSPDFDGAGCHALIIIRTDPSVIAGQFLDLVLRSRYGYESLKRVQTGALHPHLNCTWVREIAVPVPPVSEQDQILSGITGATSSFDRAIANAEREVVLFREYRTRLIADVVTGKLDVREAAARLPEEPDEPDAEDDLLEAEEAAGDAELDTEPEEVEA